MEGKFSVFGYLGKWKGRGGKVVLLLLCLLGVVLLLFGGVKTAVPQAETYFKEANAYRATMEQELAALCRGVAGVGELRVYVTLEGGEEYVYAANESSSGGVDYVIKGGEGLLLYRKTPSVAGVVVVCQGGNDPAVVASLTKLLHASLGVPYGRICISGGK